MKKILYAFLAVAMILTVGLSGCGKDDPAVTAKGPITVGSKIDTEGALLAQIIMQMLRHNDFTVNDRSHTGQTDIVRSALLNGELDIYPEYTGSGALFFNLFTLPEWQDLEAGYQKVKTLDKQANNVVWLRPAPANNTWAIAIPKSLADANNLRTLTDLAAYINAGKNFKLAGSEEFFATPDALPAFKKTYGFELKPEQLVVLSLGDTAATEKAAADGTQGVNAGMAFGTDGGLAALGLITLEDNKHAQPVYAPAPLVRGAVYEQYPELSTILDPVFATLDLVTLQTLNARVDVEGRDAAAVVTEYLKSKNFLP